METLLQILQARWLWSKRTMSWELVYGDTIETVRHFGSVSGRLRGEMLRSAKEKAVQHLIADCSPASLTSPPRGWH